MKDSLFEIMMIFFKKSIAQLKKIQTTMDEAAFAEKEFLSNENNLLFIKKASKTALRVFNNEEKRKLSKASHQLLSRLLQWKIISEEQRELILNQLLSSESGYVNVEETKWTVRTVLADYFNAYELIFLDLVLYEKNDKATLH